MRFAILTQTAVLLLAPAGLISCSDPVPPTPQGAWSVSFQPQDGNTSACLIAGHNAVIGAVTDHTKEHLIANGMSEAGPEESSDLSCSVVGTNKFDVDASMQQVVQNGQNGLSIKITGITAAATEMSPAPGTAGFASPNTGGNSYTPPKDTPCQFYFIPNSGEGVASGRIWLAFKCPTIIDGSSNSTCQIKQGYAIFENCSQTAPVN